MKNVYCIVKRNLMLVAFFTLLGTGAAFAQTTNPGTYAYVDLITGNSCQQIVKVARNYGSAELSIDSYGDPLISGVIDGISYDIIFNGCTDGIDCTRLQFSARWLSTYGMGASRANEINSNSWGKLYVRSDGNLMLEKYTNVSYGITLKTLEDEFEMWRRLLNQVHELL